MNTTTISIPEISTSVAVYSNQELQVRTNKIRNLYTQIGAGLRTGVREIAVILGEIKEQKLYVDDGFKSVAEYAEDAFGLKQSAAYGLATAGILYNSDKIPAPVKDLSPYTLAHLSTLSEDEIVQAYESGDITVNSTQADVRNFVKEFKALKKAIPAKAEEIRSTGALTDETATLPDTVLAAISEYSPSDINDAYTSGKLTSAMTPDEAAKAMASAYEKTEKIVKYRTLGTSIQAFSSFANFLDNAAYTIEDLDAAVKNYLVDTDYGYEVFSKKVKFGDSICIRRIYVAGTFCEVFYLERV